MPTAPFEQARSSDHLTLLSQTEPNVGEVPKDHIQTRILPLEASATLGMS